MYRYQLPLSISTYQDTLPAELPLIRIGLIACLSRIDELIEDRIVTLPRCMPGYANMPVLLRNTVTDSKNVPVIAIAAAGVRALTHANKQHRPN